MFRSFSNSEVLDRRFDAAADQFQDRRRHQHAARRRVLLLPRHDVDAVAPGGPRLRPSLRMDGAAQREPDFLFGGYLGGTVALDLQSRARRLDRAGELDQQALAQRLEDADRAARDVADNIAPPLPQDLLRRVSCTARDNSRANRVFSRLAAAEGCRIERSDYSPLVDRYDPEKAAGAFQRKRGTHVHVHVHVDVDGVGQPEPRRYGGGWLARVRRAALQQRGLPQICPGNACRSVADAALFQGLGSRVTHMAVCPGVHQRRSLTTGPITDVRDYIEANGTFPVPQVTLNQAGLENEVLGVLDASIDRADRAVEILNQASGIGSHSLLDRHAADRPVEAQEYLPADPGRA